MAPTAVLVFMSPMTHEVEALEYVYWTLGFLFT